ncbi:MAG: nucleotide sugar dehydrogenase [Phycisphaeraceae bacterium]
MTLLEKIAARRAVVGVIGLGYVGLPLLRAFFEAGFPVIGFDVDPEKVRHLKAGHNYLMLRGDEYIRAMTTSDRFDATVDMARLNEPDAILICVPTPLGRHLEPDLTYVEKTAEVIGAALRKDQLVVLESTTYPSTTRDVVLPRLGKGGLKCGKDFYVAYSPEREDPGRMDHDTKTIPKLVGGLDAASGNAAFELYQAAVTRAILVSSAEVAESAKLLENIYRAVNIALANEMKLVLTSMGIDVWEVIDAAATKPFGFQAFYPGPGLGGHCIPIDPFYLTWKAREAGQTTKFIELAGQINRDMPEYVVHRTSLALNERGKSVRNARLLILGLAYKPNVRDPRESPAFEVIEKLFDLGAKVDYNDPYFPTTPKMRRHDLKMDSVALTPETLAAYDAVIVITHHSSYDWQFVADHAKLVIDTRGVMRTITGRREHIVSA